MPTPTDSSSDKTSDDKEVNPNGGILRNLLGVLDNDLLQQLQELNAQYVVEQMKLQRVLESETMRQVKLQGEIEKLMGKGASAVSLGGNFSNPTAAGQQEWIWDNPGADA